MEKDNYQLPPVWDVITHLTQMLSKTEPVRKRLSEASSILRRQIYENGPAGAASLHQDLPVQSLMRRCVVNDSGVVLYYLDENDFTKKEDGSAADLSGAVGQVMVEVPEHYRKTSLNAAQGYMDTEISLYPFDGNKQNR